MEIYFSNSWSDYWLSTALPCLPHPCQDQVVVMVVAMVNAGQRGN